MASAMPMYSSKPIKLEDNSNRSSIRFSIISKCYIVYFSTAKLSRNDGNV